MLCDKRNQKRSKGDPFDGSPFANPSACDQEGDLRAPILELPRGVHTALPPVIVKERSDCGDLLVS